MPKVVSYGSRRVLPEVRPSVRAVNAPGPEVFGSELFGTIQQITGRVAARMAQEARDEADELAILASQNALSTFGNERRYGPEGWETKQGANAFGIPEVEAEALNARADEIAEGLNTDRQRRAFLEARTQSAMRLDLETRRHVSTQMDAERQRQTVSAIANATNEAIAHATGTREDLPFIASAIANIEKTARSQAARLGMGEDATELLVEQSVSPAHKGVIERMIDNDQMSQAKAYFDAVKADIAGGLLGNLEEKLEAGTVRLEAQEHTDRIMAEHPDDLNAALRAARELEGVLEDDVTSRLRTRFNEQDVIDRDLARERSLEAVNIVDPGNGTFRAPEQIPTSLWQELDRTERAGLRALYDRSVGDGVGVKTDQALYFGLLEMAARDDSREAFGQLLLGQFIGRISKTDLNQLATLQRSIINEEEQAEEQRGNLRSMLDIGNSVWEAHGRERNPEEGSAESTARGVYRNLVAQGVTRLEASFTNSKQRATDDEIYAIATNLMQQSIEEESLFGSGFNPFNPFAQGRGKSFGENATFKALVDTTFDDLNRNTVKYWTDKLKEAGDFVSEQAIIDAYRLDQLKQRGFLTPPTEVPAPQVRETRSKDDGTTGPAPR